MIEIKFVGSVSAYDEDPRALLSHRGQTVDHHVVHQPVLVLFLLFALPPCGQSVGDGRIDGGVTGGVTRGCVGGQAGALRGARQL